MVPEGKSMRGLQGQFSSLMTIHIWEETALLFLDLTICERTPDIAEAILLSEGSLPEMAK